MSCYFYDWYIEQKAQFLYFSCDVADTDCAVVGRAGLAPLLHKGGGGNGKFIAAVRIAYLQGGAGYRFAFGRQEEEAVFSLDYG